MALVKRCANGSCHSAGTSRCTKCKVTWYCGRDCQKAHYKKHKRHCRAHTTMPGGTFNFLGLPREIRNKIYQELVVARFSPDLQQTYDRFTQTYKAEPSYGLRNQIDELEERLMISPGTPLWDSKGFQPLVDSRGLLFANEQLSEELIDTMYSRNTFLVAVGDTFRFKSENAGQVFAYVILKTSLARIRRLNIVIRDSVAPDERESRDRRIATIKYNMMHIVNALNAAGNTFKLLKVRYISCMAGDVERNRAAVDALLQSSSAPAVTLENSPMNGTLPTTFRLTHDRLKIFCMPACHVGDALSLLRCSIKQFMIYGDLPGDVVDRLERKFKVAELTADTGAELAANTARFIEKYDAETVR